MRESRVALLPTATVTNTNAQTQNGNAINLNSGYAGTPDGTEEYGIGVEIVISTLTGSGAYNFFWEESDDGVTFVKGDQASVIGAVAPFPTVNGATATAIKIKTRHSQARAWTRLSNTTSGTISCVWAANIVDGIAPRQSNAVEYST